MDIRRLHYMIFNLTFLLLGSAYANPVDNQLRAYQLQGVLQVDINNGKELWYSQHNKRSCTSCHGNTPLATGQHVKTRKSIDPMAPSVNPARYQNSKKIEKWFLRNCKWTLGRVCSVQEKADLLGWLSTQ